MGIVSSVSHPTYVIIPCFREFKRVGLATEKISQFLRKHRGRAEHFHFIWTVEHSADETLALVQKMADRLQIEFTEHAFFVRDNLVHRGKGYAIRSGIGALPDLLPAQIVFYMDFDLSVNMPEIYSFLDLFSDPALEIVIAERPEKNLSLNRKAHQNMMRNILSKIFILLRSQLVQLPYRDTQCGFKAFRGSTAKRLFKHSTIDGFLFDVELLLIAQQWRLRLKTKEIEWTNEEFSTLNPFTDSLKMLYDLIFLRLRTLRWLPRWTAYPAPVTNTTRKK